MSAWAHHFDRRCWFLLRWWKRSRSSRAGERESRAALRMAGLRVTGRVVEASGGWAILMWDGFVGGMWLRGSGFNGTFFWVCKSWLLGAVGVDV
jgi:hypothetical protein